MADFSILFFGFLLGMRHATEADHLAAIFTLSTEKVYLSRGLKLGLAWGVGHTLTLAILGGAVLVFGKTISIDAAQYLEVLVGIMLIFLGCDVLRRHFQHERCIKLLLDFLPYYPLKTTLDLKKCIKSSFLSAVLNKICSRAILVGMVHGLAGSSALVLITLQKASSTSVGILYILIFGIGSILGMAMLSTIILFATSRSTHQSSLLTNLIVLTASLISILIGAKIIFSIILGLS